MRVLDNQFDLGFKGQSQINLESVLWLVPRTSLTAFDGRYIVLKICLTDFSANSSFIL